MKYSLIVLNRNGFVFVERFFASLSNTVGKRDDCEVIFVDNGSTDGSMEFAQGFEKLPLTVIKNKVNVSFSAGNNQGVDACSGDFLIFVNNDIEFFSDQGQYDDWIDALQSAYDEESNSGRTVGCVGAKLLYPLDVEHEHAGRVQHAGIIFGRDHTDSFFAPMNYGKGEVSQSFTGKNRFCAVTAALMMIPREKFDSVGGFDEKFFYNFEDVDLCLRLGEMGCTHVVQNEITVYHHESVSQKKHWNDDHGRKIHESALYFKKLWDEKIFTLLYGQERKYDDHRAQKDLYSHLISAELAMRESDSKNEELLRQNHLLKNLIEEREKSLSPSVVKIGHLVTIFHRVLSRIVFAVFHPLALIRKYVNKK